MEWEKTLTFFGETRLLKVRYFVLPHATCNSLGTPCYGIGISEGDTSYTVPFFSPDRVFCVQTAEWLSRHLVTPTSFWEVMDDFLSENTAF